MAERNQCAKCRADLTWVDCGRCGGSGEVDDDDAVGPDIQRCPDCHGAGEYPECLSCRVTELVEP